MDRCARIKSAASAAKAILLVFFIYLSIGKTIQLNKLLYTTQLQSTYFVVSSTINKEEKKKENDYSYDEDDDDDERLQL